MVGQYTFPQLRPTPDQAQLIQDLEAKYQAHALHDVSLEEKEYFFRLEKMFAVLKLDLNNLQQSYTIAPFVKINPVRF